VEKYIGVPPNKGGGKKRAGTRGGYGLNLENPYLPNSPNSTADNVIKTACKKRGKEEGERPIGVANAKERSKGEMEKS